MNTPHAPYSGLDWPYTPPPQRKRNRRLPAVAEVTYLHLMRAVVLRRVGIRPEVFVFSTALRHRSPEVALERANAQAADRYGGAHIGRSIGALLTPPHGNALRGAVVIIASDGSDADSPEVLGRALARVRRRAELVIWLNPRAACPEFRPLAGSMAAALPYCDLILPAHSPAALRQLFDVLAA